jgi:hypothetical protein
MDLFPILQILFWIAMTVAPQGTKQIIITGPEMSLTWTNEDGAWKDSETRNVWTIDGTKVTSTGTEDKAQGVEVAGFVKGVKGQDWVESPSINLGAHRSLAKVGETFVYILNEGDPTAKRYVISFKKK